MFFFGDSLTDTGNYPTPSNYQTRYKPLRPWRGNDLKQFNLYVPITNPVPSNLYGNGSTDVDPIDYPNQKFLEASLGALNSEDAGKINGNDKTLYSINWPLDLVYNLNSDHPPLITWYRHTQDSKLPTTHLNYAWASAVVGYNPDEGAGCYQDSGEPFPGECSDPSIKAARDNYKDATKSGDHHTYGEIEIPNLSEQINLYKEELNLIETGDKVTAFVYIGGNDIAYYLKKNLLKILTGRMDKEDIDKRMQAVTDNLHSAIGALVHYYKSKGVHYKIDVMTVPDLSLLHEGYVYNRVSPKITTALKDSVNTYNDDLKKMVMDLESENMLHSTPNRNS